MPPPIHTRELLRADTFLTGIYSPFRTREKIPPFFSSPRVPFPRLSSIVPPHSAATNSLLAPPALTTPALDRISAYDVILKVTQTSLARILVLLEKEAHWNSILLQNGIPTKGAILTLLSAKWFEVLSSRVPGLKHHFLHLGPPASCGLTADEQQILHGRSMTVRCGVDLIFSHCNQL